MGNWNINIQGVGCHHNKDNPSDAEKMAQKFVDSLVAANHRIDHATFTWGSALEITVGKQQNTEAK